MTGWNPMSQQFAAPPVTLAEFLSARLDEDEKRARYWIAVDVDGVCAYNGAESSEMVSRYGDFDPSRVLAEIESKRRIIALHSDERDHGEGRITHTGVCDTCGDKYGPGLVDEYPCLTLRLLALPYADHADYRDEWRPETWNPMRQAYEPG